LRVRYAEGLSISVLIIPALCDRTLFDSGEPTIHLPYIEKLIEEARRIKPDTKVNFDTNGYMTEESLERILGFTTSITYDLKAYMMRFTLP